MSTPERPGLRERKKAKTRASIQAHALRLFREHGYAATTVEQIAEAAEVSPSTFFRYFPTKEDVVLHDRYDPLLLAAFHAAPPELKPVAALRHAIAAVLGTLPADEQQQERERGLLIMSVPELRARSLEQLVETAQMLAEALAARVGRAPHDQAVRMFTGAICGIAIAILLDVADEPSADYLALFDEGLAYLEAGLPL